MSEGHNSIGSDSMESFDAESTNWGMQQRLFSIMHQLYSQRVAFPVLFIIEQLLFLYFGCQYLFPNDVFPINFSLDVIIWTISIALCVSLLCVMFLVLCAWQFWKNNAVNNRIGELFQFFGTLYGSGLLFVMMCDASVIGEIGLQMLFSSSLILWLVLVAPLQIMGLYPRNTISASLDSRSENRIGMLFLIVKIMFFLMNISLSSVSHTFLYVSVQVILILLIASYIVNRLPYIHYGVNVFVLTIMYATSLLFILRYSFHRWNVSINILNAIISLIMILLISFVGSYGTLLLRRYSFGYRHGIVKQLRVKTVPTDTEVDLSSAEGQQFGEVNEEDEEAGTPVIDAYVGLLIDGTRNANEIDIKMREIWRECDKDMVEQIYDKCLSRMDSDTVDASTMSLRYAEYILEYMQEKKSETKKGPGRYEVENINEKTSVDTQRMLFQVVKVLRKCQFRYWDNKFRTFSARERRIECDQTNRSRQLILARHIRNAERLKGEGVRILAEFWRHVAKGSSSEKLSQYVDMLYHIESKGRAIYNNLLVSFSRNPVVLRSYANFVEQIELNMEKANQIRATLGDDDSLEPSLREGAKDTNQRSVSQPGKGLPTTHSQYAAETSAHHSRGPSCRVITKLPTTDPEKDSEIGDGQYIGGGQSSYGGSMTNRERNHLISHSPVVQRLKFSIYIVMLAVLLVAVILFFVTNNYVRSQFEEEGDEAEKEGREKMFYRYTHVLEMGVSWHQAAFRARGTENARKCDEEEFEEEREEFVEMHEELHELFHHLASAGLEEVASAWEKTYPTKKNWPSISAGEHSTDYKTAYVSAFEIFTAMELSTEVIAECEESDDPHSASCNDTRKYLVTNAEYSWADAFQDVNNAYKKKVRDNIDVIEIVVISSFCSCIVILLVVIVLVFIPVLLHIKREKKSVFQMFTLIPKEETATLYRSFCTRANKHGFQSGNRLTTNQKARSSLAGMPWRFSVSLLILGITISAMLFIPLLYTSDSRYVAIELQGFSMCSQLAFKTFFHLREMLANDTVYVPTYWTMSDQRQSIMDTSNNLRQLWKEFLFGNNEHPPVAYRSSDLLRTLYLDEESVNHFVKFFINEFDYFSRLDDSDMDLEDPRFEELHHEAHHFLEIVPIAQAYYEAYYSARTELYRTMNTLIFIMALPLLFITYFLLLHPSVRTIYEQNRKMRSLFLLLPMQCLQSQRVIMDYIFSGQYSDEKEVVQSITSSERKKGRILQAASDGFIEINKDLSVTEYNLAAARMFGYEAEKVVGQNVELLFDDISNGILVKEVEACHRTFGESSRKSQKEVEKREGRELIGVKKDGSRFDVRVHLIAQQIEQEVIVAGFLEDITQEKKQKKLLDEEKAKSNELLLNILPHTIAERLKRGDELIADKHLDCTILFTDIVGFTRFSSDKEPEEVVSRLRSLFTRYDEMSTEAQIMKIKTIGDAYMAVMGLEEKVSNDPLRVAELAIRMIEVAKECDFEIRAGIHVGKLTAGVVGVKKMTYDVWGNSVNIASRMESTSLPGHLQVSREAYELLYDKFEFRERKITVKGFDEEQFVYLCLKEKDVTSAGEDNSGNIADS